MTNDINDLIVAAAACARLEEYCYAMAANYHNQNHYNETDRKKANQSEMLWRKRGRQFSTRLTRLLAKLSESGVID